MTKEKDNPLCYPYDNILKVEKEVKIKYSKKKIVKQLRFIVKAEGHICINRLIDEDKIQTYINITKNYGNKYAVVDGNHNLIEGDLETMQQGLNQSKL